MVTWTRSLLRVLALEGSESATGKAQQLTMGKVSAEFVCAWISCVSKSSSISHT